MPAERSPVTRMDMERWALGRLSPPESREIEARRAADPDLAARMDRVKADIDRASDDLPPLRLPVDEPAPWWRRPWLPVAAGALALAAAATFAVLPTEPEVVYRGTFDLKVHRVRGGEVHPEGAMITAAPGDRLQYAVTASEDGYLAVFDVQDDGEVQAWMPARPVAARQTVEGAVLLDDYAGAERVFFVVGAHPVEPEAVRHALPESWKTPLADLDALRLGQGVVQRSVLVVKELP